MFVVKVYISAAFIVFQLIQTNNIFLLLCFMLGFETKMSENMPVLSCPVLSSIHFFCSFVKFSRINFLFATILNKGI